MTIEPQTAQGFQHVDISLDHDVLELTLHTNGGPLVYTELAQREMLAAFALAAEHPDRRCVLLTGAGDAFIEDIDWSSFAPNFSPQGWDGIMGRARRMMSRLLEIDVPVVAAVNGPALVHAELAVMSDVVIASENAVFQDKPHLEIGQVPGDGVHIIWPAVLGLNRGRYFLLTQQKLSAREAHDLGVVGEVLPRDELLPRAREIARRLAALPPLTGRYTRLVLTQRLRRLVEEGMGYGLALEGLSSLDLANQDD
jgi:enoyl-CoA hydratase/carnithine racemase